MTRSEDRSSRPDARSGAEPADHGDETIDVTRSGSPEDRLGVGMTVSRYVVLAELGVGGMGRVMRAYDPKLEREVALKEVRREALDPVATQRLVAEARAMAKLSHPNVVSVFDVEELPTEEVVLVMEYVRGQTLREWLRPQRPWREIVDRFHAAGLGLQAAHRAGLLHRDFKPTNVLVDGDTVKVTDFGLARPVASATPSDSFEPSTDPEDLTDGVAVMGTPRYMAPEQHRLEPLTAAADQFAFCVALWEGICGAVPYSGRTMAQDKCKAPPPWPNRDVPGAIVETILRGLSPAPEDRWPSMADLLAKLEWDPARRRNAWMLGLGGITMATLAGVAYDSWADAKARQCDQAQAQLVGIWDETRRSQVEQALLGVGTSYATAVWTRTEEALDAYATAWTTMHTEACAATTIHGEQSPQMLDLRMGCLRRAAMGLGATVDVLADADAEVVRRAHTLAADLPPLERCADIEALAAGVEPPLRRDADAVERARLQLARGETLERAGRYDEAFAAIEAGKVELQTAEYEPVLAEVALLEGSVLSYQGHYEDAESALARALQLSARSRQWEVMAGAATRLMHVVGIEQGRTEDAFRYEPLAQGLAWGHPSEEIAWRNTLASLLVRRGKLEEAEAEHRAALALAEATREPGHPLIAMMRNNLANTLAARGQSVVAEAEHRAVLAMLLRTLGPDHPDVALSHNNLAHSLVDQGKYEDAEHELRTALEIRIAALGPEHPDVADARNTLAIVLESQGKNDEAEAEFRATLATRKAVLDPLNPVVAQSHNNLANFLRIAGKYEEAIAEHRTAMALRTSAEGPEHPSVADSHANLSLVFLDQERFAEAEVEQRRALEILTAAMGDEHPLVADALYGLAVISGESGDLATAEAQHRAALSIWKLTMGEHHPHVAMAQHGIAHALLRQGRSAEAHPLAEQVWARRRDGDIPREAQAETAMLLAEILWTVDEPLRDQARARELASRALELYREVGSSQDEEARTTRAWLDEHPAP